MFAGKCCASLTVVLSAYSSSADTQCCCDWQLQYRKSAPVIWNQFVVFSKPALFEICRLLNFNQHFYCEKYIWMRLKVSHFMDWYKSYFFIYRYYVFFCFKWVRALDLACMRISLLKRPCFFSPVHALVVGSPVRGGWWRQCAVHWLRLGRRWLVGSGC